MKSLFVKHRALFCTTLVLYFVIYISLCFSLAVVTRLSLADLIRHHKVTAAVGSYNILPPSLAPRPRFHLSRNSSTGSFSIKASIFIPHSPTRLRFKGLPCDTPTICIYDKLSRARQVVDSFTRFICLFLRRKTHSSIAVKHPDEDKLFDNYI